MKLSVKPVPAARILMRTWPGPGSGMVGCSANYRTAGPPNRVIQMCCHDMIALSYHGSDVIAVESVFLAVRKHCRCDRTKLLFRFEWTAQGAAPAHVNSAA